MSELIYKQRLSAEIVSLSHQICSYAKDVYEKNKELSCKELEHLNQYLIIVRDEFSFLID